MILMLRIFLQQALVKNKLLLPTLSVVFPLMASPPSEDDDFDDEDEDDEVEEGTEASRPCAVASQVKCSTIYFIDILNSSTIDWVGGWCQKGWRD